MLPLNARFVQNWCKGPRASLNLEPALIIGLIGPAEIDLCPGKGPRGQGGGSGRNADAAWVVALAVLEYPDSPVIVVRIYPVRIGCRGYQAGIA